MSCLLPRAKLLRVTFFMKGSYLLHHENFKLPYPPHQAHCDLGICSQLRSSHIHSLHQKSCDFIHGNFVYLALICTVWSSRGRTGKKVTVVTFFRWPTVYPSKTIWTIIVINDPPVKWDGVLVMWGWVEFHPESHMATGSERCFCGTTAFEMDEWPGFMCVE